MAKTLPLRSRFAVWTSAVVIASSMGLMFSVYLVSSRALREQSDEEMEVIASKTTEQLDLWISSRERDAVNISELQPLVAGCSDHKLAEVQQALDRIQSRSPFYENVFPADTNGKLFLDSIGGKSVGIELMSIEGFRSHVEHAVRIQSSAFRVAEPVRRERLKSCTMTPISTSHAVRGPRMLDQKLRHRAQV